MTKGDLTPAARASNPPVESGFAPPNPQAAVAAHTSALAASGALDSDAFTRRHQALSSSVEARTLVVKKQLHALARLQGEIGALTGPSVVSVEDMRKSLSVLSMEVEAARQAFEAARKAKAAADDKVQGQAAMKEALIERLTQIVAQNEAAKMSKLTELLGSLDNLDVDIDPEAVAKVAKAAADAVRRGGSAASSDVRVPLGREEDPIAARAKALKELGEQAAPAFEGF
ncbi:hypothetical protein T492DRAFT_1065205 [Pavlovales sp. CCMP2436]|nr:hypothetical protein T492DRAFT_1065205 [Pavlovales sp. CCMP2436]